MKEKTEEKVSKLIDVKSIVTLFMTLILGILLIIPWDVNKELLMLFSSTYGSIITYFFTKKNNDEK